MGVTITRRHYGMVEPNQLSAQKNGQIYASLPLDPQVELLQNGELMYYSYVDNMVTAEPTLEGQEPMLVFNEIKLYDEYWRNSAVEDFAMIRVSPDMYITQDPRAMEVRPDADATDSGYKPMTGYRLDGIVPRLFKTAIGDIYTTNMVKEDVEYEVGDILVPAVNSERHTLVLEKGDSDLSSIDGMAWAVVKAYTVPSGGPGIKLQRVK